jgi:hypothetical protein
MKPILVTCYVNPDLDGVAGAIAYAGGIVGANTSTITNSHIESGSVTVTGSNGGNGANGGVGGVADFSLKEA